MDQPTFSECFSKPDEVIVRLSEDGIVARDMLGAWFIFFCIAVLGSLFFGASMSLVFPSMALGKGALLILLSAGLGWFVFGPLLLLVSKLSMLLCAHACMVTMAYGESVLFVGALGNGALWVFQSSTTTATLWNALSLLVGNLTMAYVLASQLRELGVPLRATILTWIIGLNGSGVLFFLLFSKVL